MELEKTVWQVRRLAQEFRDFFDKPKKKDNNTQTHWSRPAPGCLKLNVDESFNVADASGGWGFVVRDDTGDVVLSAAGRILHAQDPLHAEAEACRQALTMIDQYF